MPRSPRGDRAGGGCGRPCLRPRSAPDLATRPGGSVATAGLLSSRPSWRFFWDAVTSALSGMSNRLEVTASSHLQTGVLCQLQNRSPPPPPHLLGEEGCLKPGGCTQISGRPATARARTPVSVGALLQTNSAVRFLKTHGAFYTSTAEPREERIKLACGHT